jgi:hypothetical protein
MLTNGVLFERHFKLSHQPHTTRFTALNGPPGPRQWNLMDETVRQLEAAMDTDGAGGRGGGG